MIRNILETNEVVEEFRVVPKKKKWKRPTKDTNLVRRLILAAGDVIRARYWKGVDVERKDKGKTVI